MQSSHYISLLFFIRVRLQSEALEVLVEQLRRDDQHRGSFVGYVNIDNGGGQLTRYLSVLSLQMGYMAPERLAVRLKLHCWLRAK